ncbi:MAG TPA: gamma-glutamyltransferase [Mycobacteriales bacterium]|nr:gamma-glutamyltransferase [Mycobacteriales bacterium]
MSPIDAVRFAPNGIVCAVDHLAAGAGVQILRRGGSAVDAAVATSAVLAVTTQHMCGMGGDLFALVSRDGDAPLALNASGRAGSGADPDRLRAEGHTEMPMYDDIRAVPVPGCVDGWLALHARGGRLDLADVLGPAIGYARDGFPASPGLSAAVDALGRRPAAAHLWVGGRPPQPGDLVRRPGVAQALEAVVRDGRDGFYGGEFGAGLVALGRGEYVEADLAATLADWVDPLGLTVFGQQVWTIPPNSQGYLSLAAAWIAEGLDLPVDSGDPIWAHLTIEAARAAAYDRVEVLHEHADGYALIAPERLAPRRSAISRDRAQQLGGTYRPGGTIHLAVVDRERTGVSLIQSNAAGFGTMLAEPTTGIFLQNRGVGFSLQPGHQAEYGPGRRPPHTLAPALVTTDDHRLHTVLGTMGGDAQPQILLQLLARLLHDGEPAASAVAAARWALASRDGHGFSTWRDRGVVDVQLEDGVPRSWAGELTARGHSVVPRPYGAGFGHAHVITVRDDVLEGASDGRAVVGAAAGY